METLIREFALALIWQIYTAAYEVRLIWKGLWQKSNIPRILRRKTTINTGESPSRIGLGQNRLIGNMKKKYVLFYMI